MAFSHAVSCMWSKSRALYVFSASCYHAVGVLKSLGYFFVANAFKSHCDRPSMYARMKTSVEFLWKSFAHCEL